VKVHHVDAATMCPIGKKIVAGHGGLFERARLVCHCLVIETDRGLVVVDTGLGLDDVASPKARLGGMFASLVGPVLDAGQCIASRVESLGFKRSDVRHILLTHLDVDHAGGLPDFPEATIHIHATEHDAAMARRTFFEKERYRPCQWAHGPKWETYDAKGEGWKGLRAVRELKGLGPEFLIIPTEGHTRGHAAIAVDTGSGWLLHAGDAYFFHEEMNAEAPRCTPALAYFQRTIAIDNDLRLENQARLRELKAKNSDVTIFSAHSDVELAAFG
jgi:glyoxylase-like metal-dependent hydrolase (beta-lactamase superfamily II)